MSTYASLNSPHEVMSATDVRRAIVRIAHEIIERNHGVEGLAIVGLQRGGTWIAEAITKQINEIESAVTVPVGALDVSLHRDDIGLRPFFCYLILTCRKQEK